MKQDAWKHPFFSDQMPACALKGHWASFCLVDETGSGKAYGGLPYTIFDSAGRQYDGRLDGDGFARLKSFYCGPIVLKLDSLYSGAQEPYNRLRIRQTYQLPITELQVRAEQTRFSAKDGQRIKGNPAQSQADRFYQVEVRDLVRHVAHLPPQIPRTHSPQRHALKMMAELGFGPPQPSLTGIVL